MAVKNKAEKLRFGLVGAANTVIDIGMLFILTSIGLPAIFANIVSTSTAFTFSFFANKKYTFRSTGANLKREVFLFTIVTLFGLWVLQTAVLQLMTLTLSKSGLPSNFILFIAKLCAVAVSLVWNYTLYSRVVFKKKEE